MALLINAALVLPYELLRFLFFFESEFEFKAFAIVLLSSYAAAVYFLHKKNGAWTFGTVFSLLVICSFIATLLRLIFTYIIIISITIKTSDAYVAGGNLADGLFEFILFICLALPLAISGLIYGVRKLMEKGAA